MKSLFGEDIPDIDAIHRNSSLYQKFRARNHYGLAKSWIRSCKQCVNCIKSEYHDKNYYKCKLQGMSNSEASDIRLRNTCDLFASCADKY